jgi:hypothetical protein
MSSGSAPKRRCCCFRRSAQNATTEDVAALSARYRLSSGETLEEASRASLLAIVFLRHFGCTFTRQILRGLESLRTEAENHGARLVIAHMLSEGGEAKYTAAHEGVARIADPTRELYYAFGLRRGGCLELLGPKVWIRGIVALFRGCGVGPMAGDGLQMPGAFLFRDNRIVARQPARTAADLPDIHALFHGMRPDAEDRGQREGG